MSNVDAKLAGEKLAAVIAIALTVSEAEVDALGDILRREETLLPFMDPTRWRAEGKGLSMAGRVIESFAAFRRVLAQTPAGQAIATTEGASVEERALRAGQAALDAAARDLRKP